MIYEIILTFWLLIGIIGLYFGTQGHYGIGFGSVLLVGFVVFEFIGLIGNDAKEINDEVKK